MFNCVQDIAGIDGNSVKLFQDEEVNGIDDNRAHNHTWNTPQTTNNDHGQINNGVSGVKTGGRDGPQFCGVEDTCNTGEKRSSSKSEELCAYQINTRGRGGDLIFTHS